MNDYIYQGDKIAGFQFYKLPHALINGEEFKSLSSNAKLLYTLMLDRTSLSIKSHWSDSGGKVYINYPLSEISEKLNICMSKASKLMKELESFGLIERIRIGLCKPNTIYVKTFLKIEHQDCDDSELKIDDYEQSELLENINSEMSNEELLHYNNQTENTILIDSDLSSQSFEGNEMNDYFKNRDYILDLVKENIEYDWFARVYDLDKDDPARPFGSINILDSIVDIIVDCICSTKQYIRVNRANSPTEVVRSYFLSLNNDNIQHILTNLNDHAVDVTNVRAYIITMLYNEITTRNIAESIEFNE